jgi:hypothetical protein
MLKIVSPGRSENCILKNTYCNYVLLYFLGKNLIIPAPSVFTCSRLAVIIHSNCSINAVNYIIFSWFSFIVKKIKFRHKISWVYIKRNCSQIIKLKLGLSHLVILFSADTRLQRRKKYLRHHTLVIWGLDPYPVHLLVNRIYTLQPVNTFTLRGFRYSRQRIFKRVGKVNKYSGIKKSF